MAVSRVEEDRPHLVRWSRLHYLYQGDRQGSLGEEQGRRGAVEPEGIR